jgi:hypothetical protein
MSDRSSRWFRLDVDFFDHPKAVLVGLPARGLFLASIAFCFRYETDGRVPAVIVRRLIDDGRIDQDMIVKELLEARLWEADQDGYRVHDYLDYQPSRQQRASERAAVRDRQRRSRGNRRAADNAVDNAVDGHASVTRDSGVSHAGVTPAVTPLSRTDVTGQDKTDTEGPTGPPSASPPTPPPAAQPSAKARPSPADIRRVFDTWKAERAKNGNTDYSPQRQRVITVALKAYPIEDLLNAIRGVAIDEQRWPDRAGHDDLADILHLGSARKPRNNLEYFRDLARNGPTPTRTRGRDKAQEQLDGVQRTFDAMTRSGPPGGTSYAHDLGALGGDHRPAQPQLSRPADQRRHSA